MLVIGYWLFIVNWPATACATLVIRGFQSGVICDSVIMHCYAGHCNTEANALSVTDCESASVSLQQLGYLDGPLLHLCVELWYEIVFAGDMVTWEACEFMSFYPVIYLVQNNIHWNILPLIQWGMVTHICVRIYASLKLIIIGAGCGLSCIRCQVITVPTLIYFRLDPWQQFHRDLNKYAFHFQENTFENIVRKI